MEVNPEELQRVDIGYEDNQPTFPFSINKLIFPVFQNAISFSVSLLISIGFYATFPSAISSHSFRPFKRQIDSWNGWKSRVEGGSVCVFGGEEGKG